MAIIKKENKNICAFSSSGAPGFDCYIFILDAVGNRLSLCRDISIFRNRAEIYCIKYINNRSSDKCAGYFVNRWWISSFVISTVLLVVSIANYFVIQFHAMPLSVNELRNIGTAAGVIGSYKFSVDSYVLFMLLFYLLSLVFVDLLKEIETGEKYTWKQIIFKDAVIGMLSLGILYKGILVRKSGKSGKKY